MAILGYSWLLLMACCCVGYNATPTDTAGQIRLLDDQLTALYYGSNYSDMERLEQLDILMKSHCKVCGPHQELNDARTATEPIVAPPSPPKSPAAASDATTTERPNTRTASPTATAPLSIYEDCQDAYSKGLTKSAVYNINPNGRKHMEVFCDQASSSGGWIVIQKREDGMVDFDRTWKEYKDGFGTTEGDYYLGNDNINLLTTTRPQKLRVELHHQGHGFAYAEYSFFEIGPEFELYKLKLGNFTGTNSPGDSLTYHNGQSFSTRDQDNDQDGGHCADWYSSGWWFKDCSKANLNGIYASTSEKGVTWSTWLGSTTSLTTVKMMVKPADTEAPPTTPATTPTSTPTGNPETTRAPTTPTTTVYQDCQDAFDNGQTTSGVYRISVNGTEVDVYCDQEIEDGGWTVFQRRFDGSEDFYRGWDAYRDGFGNVAGEFWLGNEYLHLLTSDQNQRLKIEMKLDDETVIVDYASFSIGNETEKYKLHVTGFAVLNPPGDSLLDHNDQPFSTPDQDNDASPINCAQMYTGAWWYKSCYESNLNGKYGDQDNTGVVWKSWKDSATSLTSVRMMFKKVEVYRDCHDAYVKGKNESGVYRISPGGVIEIDVLCEQELEKGSWMVFQRRMDGREDFYRTWDQYKSGFGSIDGEFWLGNDIIHLMTLNEDQQLLVELQYGSSTAYARYSSFSIKDESNKYQLQVSGFTNGPGSPGDSLTMHNGKFYSTKDRDNDDNNGSTSCAVSSKSAWWYYNCATSDLNARYGTGNFDWTSWGSHYPLKATRLMLKTK